MSNTLKGSQYVTFICGIIIFFVAPIALQAEENPEACNQLFGLPEGTIRMEADRNIMNPEVCTAYAFLISRYTPGPRSSVGLTSPKVEGIVKLNPDFAVALAKMLQAAPYVGIISAYRTPEGQGSKNPQSNHVYGCAVDLAHSNTSCTQSICQWVLRNSGAFGLQIRMKYSPEWNHIEPVAKDACRNNGPGVGAPVSTPSSDFTGQIRDLLGLNQVPQGQSGEGEMCRLPDGLEVPCSSIANSGALGQPPQGPSSGGAALPAQAIPSSQQPTQYFQPPPPVSSTISPETSQTGTLPKSTEGLSALERLQLLAGQQSQTQTSTSAPFVLVVRPEDAVGIQSKSTEGPIVTPLPNTSYQLTSVSQSTFTSAGFEGQSPSFAQEQTGLQKTLADMRSTLLYILDYLRPFGRPLDNEHTGEYSDWSE